MITAEQAVRNEGYGAGWREAIQRTRDEIDVAYVRGYEDGSRGKLVTILAGMVAGAVGVGAWWWVFS